MSGSGRRRVIVAAIALTLVLAWIALLGGTSGAWAASASWQYAPAAAPTPPTGVAPSPFPTDLGTVGDIEFWSPNQGLLITGGTSDGYVPAGLYAYDGASWHLLSTVCGSAQGRIAYVSGDEWWTISDQRPGLAGADVDDDVYTALSLCHFVDGVVVASYALPLGQTDSWPEMDAAACDGPDDCWFAGGISGTTAGAFHLYWNGLTLTEVDNTTDANPISSMAVLGPNLLESVTVGATSTDQSVIQTVVSNNLSNPFHDAVLADNSCTGYCPTLPEYGSGVTPDDYDGWMLASDAGSVADPVSPGNVWALAAPTTSGRNAGAQALVLHDTGGNWTQVAPQGAVLPSDNGTPEGITAVPGQEQAWMPVGDNGSNAADLDLLSSSNGGQTWSATETDNIGPAQGVGDLGAAGPIACPAANDCWMATTEGWLFNWTDGTSYPQSTDPVYNGGIGVITYRPPDAGTPNVPGTTPPPDDSLANQLPPVVLPPVTPPAKTKKVALVSDEKSKLIGNSDSIEFTFKLAAKAKVQLVASRREKATGKSAKASKAKTTLVVVARSKEQTLKKGKHAIELKLNPKRWPTSLKLDATLVKAKT